MPIAQVFFGTDLERATTIWWVDAIVAAIGIVLIAYAFRSRKRNGR